MPMSRAHHPYTGQKLAAARHQEHLTEAKRDQQASQAQAGSGNGGILDTLRRHGQRYSLAL